MGLFTFLKRPVATPAAGGDTAQMVDAARTRARRRLIGAVLLLGIGVIAFPLLFETQPRPIPVDIPIEIPKKEDVAPLAVPAPRATAPALIASGAVSVAKPSATASVLTEMKSDAGKEVPAPVESATMVTVKPEVAPKPTPSMAPASKPIPPIAPAPKAMSPGAQAPTAAPVETKSAGEAPGRFVVQVGAFADNGMAREARSKVEKLGLKTYTQMVDTDNGKRTRVRVGPFSSRDDAEKAAAKVKAGGLPAAVLTL